MKALPEYNKHRKTSGPLRRFVAADYARALQFMRESNCDPNIYKDLEAATFRVCEEQLARHDNKNYFFLEDLILQRRIAEWNLPDSLLIVIESMLRGSGHIHWTGDDVPKGPQIKFRDDWKIAECREAWRRVRRPGKRTKNQA